MFPQFVRFTFSIMKVLLQPTGTCSLREKVNNKMRRHSDLVFTPLIQEPINYGMTFPDFRFSSYGQLFS